MNYPVNLKKVIYTSVVPVECGSERGTGFFVAPDTLLTARHVVVDSALNNESVIVKTEKLVLCDVDYIAGEGEPLDVVLLKCKDYQQYDHLNLLADVFNENRQLTIIGYPKELGNCSDIISIDVQDRLNTKKEDYDTMVVRTDSLPLTSYKGFSGSPVLNEKGSVIGVALQQYGNSMGYISVKSIAELLEKKGVGVSHDWQSEDFSPLGRGTSQKQVEKAISYAALRYNRELHVADDDLDREIDLFANRKIQNEIESELQRIEDLILGGSLDFGDCLKKKYPKGNFGTLYENLSEWRDSVKANKMKLSTLDFFNNGFVKFGSLLKDCKLSNYSVLLLTGMAGMGKTHYICATAERLCQHMNVYLLFGSLFVEDRDFETQLYELMGIEGQNLNKLNEKMVKVNANAIIMIDALNEGATETFWKVAMRHIKELLDKYHNIKVVTSYRNEEGFGIPKSSCYNKQISGFRNKVDEAIAKYFKYYHIEDYGNGLRNKFRIEFNEPLFLSMFCQVARGDMKYMTGKFSYFDLFHEYLKYRNDIVSKGVDEDSHRNVTEKVLMQFANYSLYYKDCNDIPRRKARCYADQICRNRTWSHNLLYWLLKENLVLPSGYEGETLMFGYQKLGDFLMAERFVNNKMTNKAKVDFILEKGSHQENYSYWRFILALLPEWELTPVLLERTKKENHSMVSLILNSLKHRGKNNQAIFDWMQSNRVYNLRILHDFLSNLSVDVFIDANHKLKKMNIADRDKEWSPMVNDIYSSRYDEVRLERFIDILYDKTSNEDLKKVVILLCWMCTTPHPFVRGKVMRKLVSLFDGNNSMASFALDEFHDCNDPYVVQVCVCAIYGYLLRKHEAKISAEIAEKVLLYFYQNNYAPEDILVRQWTMLILALADELNANSEYFHQIRPPFSSGNPFASVKDGKGNIGEDYFGTSKGSWKMYQTLYGFSDFKRYILGSNNHAVSYVFMKKDNKKVDAIPLVDIMQLIANIAKHDFGWNDELGKLDDHVYSEGRYNNVTERYGKKYLWLALYKADALLSDCYEVVDESRYVFSPELKDLEPIPYPWHTHEYSRIDPTILDKQDAVSYTSFQTSDMENVENISDELWLSKDYPVQEPRLKVTDIDGSEWIVLTCDDGHKTDSKADTVKDLFLFTNASFVKNNELEIFKDWAKDQNFYGRWMPERRNGSIEYLWNEYPWAQTYKRTLRDMEDSCKDHKGKKFHLYLSYEAQLQEEWIGLDENEINLREASMPEHRVMECLDLYTAERGVVRYKADNTIVARNFAIGKMNGLAMRKDFLEKYLLENDMSLVFYSLGEKYVRGRDSYQTIGNRYDLSGAYYYANGEINDIQPMHISNTLDNQ